MATVRERIAQNLKALNLPVDLEDILTGYAQDPNLRLIMVTGSGARQELQPYSDIDVILLWGQTFSYPPYELRYLDEQLISLTSLTYQEWTEKLSMLQEAMFVRHATLDAKVVYEVSHGIYQGLWEMASELDMSRFDTERGELVNHMIHGFVEELHKVFNGVSSNDPHLTYYGMMGLQFGISKILGHHFGLEYITENHVISQAIEKLTEIGQDRMVLLWNSMWGFDEQLDMIDRGRAAIEFYLLMIDLVDERLKAFNRIFLTTTKKLGWQLLGGT
ncbi:MAG: hypothetical protein ACXAE3_09820 [Candidatus Kariarchaeaceae archaeon]|jgi:predicted nucleotidyltransferase